MNGPTLTRELKRLSIPHRSKGEAGIKRVQLLDAFGLGLPTVKSWTKKSIVYMLEEIFKHTDYDHDNVKTKDAAIRFLQDFIAKKCLGPPPPAPNTTEANTTVRRYKNLATKLRDLGEENDALICDHADNFGEQIDPEILERLMSISRSTWGENVTENDGENSTSKRLFEETEPLTPDMLKKKRQLLMQQMTSVDRLLKQDATEPTRVLRNRTHEAQYVESDQGDTHTSSSGNSSTEDANRNTTMTRQDSRDTTLQRSHSTGSFGIIWSRYDSTDETGEYARRFLQQPLNLTRSEGG